MVGFVSVLGTQTHEASRSGNADDSGGGYGRRNIVSATAAEFAVERTAQSRISTVDFSSLPFGTLFSDHMLLAEYRDGRWSKPRIKPYGPLLLPPNISALQYGIS